MRYQCASRPANASTILAEVVVQERLPCLPGWSPESHGRGVSPGTGVPRTGENAPAPSAPPYPPERIAAGRASQATLWITRPRTIDRTLSGAAAVASGGKPRSAPAARHSRGQSLGGRAARVE